MSKGIIIYQSKYGSTKKYVQWLQEATGFDAIEVKKAKADIMNDYNTVVLCGAVYASGIAGISYLRNNKNALAGKRTAVFCVGASPYDEKALKEDWKLGSASDYMQVSDKYREWLQDPILHDIRQVAVMLGFIYA